jgi:hypothetical protein
MSRDICVNDVARHHTSWCRRSPTKLASTPAGRLLRLEHGGLPGGRRLRAHRAARPVGKSSVVVVGAGVLVRISEQLLVHAV